MTIQIVDGPSHGTMSVSPDGTFEYTTNSGFTGLDSFSYQIDDGHGLSNVGVVSIEIQTYAVAPPPSPPESGDSDSEDSSENDSESSASDGSDGDTADDTEAPVDDGKTARQRGPRLGDSIGNVSALPEPDEVESVDEESEADSEFLPRRTHRQPTRTAWNERSTESAARTSEEQASVPSATWSDEMDRVIHVAGPGALWQQLDEFHESVDSEAQLSTVFVGSVGGVVSSFTVGYVVWAIRSGIVLSSLLAGLPAWTMFDPLAVVPVGDSDADEEDESLEQIVEKQSQRLSENENRNDA